MMTYLNERNVLITIVLDTHWGEGKENSRSEGKREGGRK